MFNNHLLGCLEHVHWSYDIIVSHGGGGGDMVTIRVIYLYLNIANEPHPLDFTDMICLDISILC